MATAIGRGALAECQRKAMKDTPDTSQKNRVGITSRLNSSCFVLSSVSAGMGGRGRVQTMNQRGALIKLKFLNECHGISIQNAEQCGLFSFSFHARFILNQAFYFVKVAVKE